MKSKTKEIKRIRDQKKYRQGLALAKNGQGTDTDDSSISSESSLSSEISSSDEESDTNDLILEDTKLPGTKPINLHDAENKLLRQSYEYDADGNVTVVEH